MAADLLRRARVAGRAARRARRRADPAALTADALHRLRALLPVDAVESAVVVEVPASARPWIDSGLELRAGDAVTTFAAGRVSLGPLGVCVPPAAALWMRVGGREPIFRGPRDTHSFTAATGGRLELAMQFAGRWADRSGTDRAPLWERRTIMGGAAVLAVRWASGADVDAALREAAAADPSGLANAELERRAAPAAALPDGWEHLGDIGPSEIYATADDGIACTTHGDVGIVRTPVDVPLTDATRLRWAWRVDALPSELAEDTLPTHDYLSIALEFDDGTDLTWHWSAELPVGHHYACPLPAWRGREWHQVVRTGTADLGRWVTEERPVRADVARAIGPPPRRIVAVWLIAVSVFQRGHGRCAYGPIELIDDRQTVRVPGTASTWPIQETSSPTQ